MVSPFEYENYRDFIRQRVKSMPSNGHGQLTRMAKHISIHPTLVTQVLSGIKGFSSDQGLLVCEYLGLSEAETDYFLALIELERAGHHKLKARITQKIKSFKERNNKARGRVPKHTVLPEADRATFYSSWFYSAIRLATDVKDMHSIDSIAVSLGLERKLVQEVLEYLVRSGLVIQENGLFKMGPQRTYLPPDSPLISRHHTNWRLKAIEKFHKLSEEELAFTAPVSLSKADLPKVKKILLNSIEQISKLVAKSDSETVACVSLDFFKLVD